MTSNLIQLNCPSCGAPLHIQDNIKCEYCGSEYLLKDNSIIKQEIKPSYKSNEPTQPLPYLENELARQLYTTNTTSWNSGVNSLWMITLPIMFLVVGAFLSILSLIPIWIYAFLVTMFFVGLWIKIDK